MKRKNTFKTIFTICLSVTLIAVQCFGSLMVSAANDSVSYNFDEWEPVEVAGVSNAYQPPSGWSGYLATYGEKNYFYKEDGAMGYKRTYTAADYNAGVYTSIPTDLDKNDFFVDFSSYWKSYIAAPEIMINMSGPTSIFVIKDYISKNSWQQFSVRFKKNDEGNYDVSLYIDGVLKSSATKAISKFNELRLRAQTYSSTASGTLEFLLDNVNIRKTPTTLSVTPSVVNNATDVPTDEPLKYELSQDIDKTTLELITVKDSEGNVVSIEPAYDYRTKTVTINPVLSLNKTYTVDFSKVRDVLGNAPSVSSYTFETVKQRVFVNETFDSYTAEENAFPVSSTGTWSEGKYTLSGDGGVFTNTIANSGTSTINPMMKYTLTNAVTETKLFLEFDYKYTGSGSLSVKLYDSNKNWSKAEWNLKTGISQDNSWHKLQAIITNGTTVNDSSAKIYIDGVYSGETTPTAANKSWNGKLTQIAFQPTIYGNKTSSLSLDNIKLSTLPTELNVTSSLDEKNSGLPLGEDIMFTFDNPIDTATVGNAKITAGGVSVGEAEYDEETNTIKFVYDAETPLVENTTYSVDLSGVKDIFGNAPKKSYSFTTVEKAEVKVLENTFSVLEDGEYDVNDGFGGGVVTATIKAVNTTVKDSNVMIAIAMYDENFSTMKAVSVEHVTIPCTGAETTISATLPNDDYEDEDTIKVFVFDSVTLKPFRNAFAANSVGVVK